MPGSRRRPPTPPRRPGVVAFSESLRRELDGTGVNVLHLVTPGVDTDMLDATREVYGGHMDADSWSDESPDEWAAKVVRAIERDDHVLGPGGRLAIAKLASRGPGDAAGRGLEAHVHARAAVARARDQRLHRADAALDEATLRPGEVELEQAMETAVAAEPRGPPPRRPSQRSRHARSVGG